MTIRAGFNILTFQVTYSQQLAAAICR